MTFHSSDSISHYTQTPNIYQAYMRPFFSSSNAFPLSHLKLGCIMLKGVHCLWTLSSHLTLQPSLFISL